MCQASCRFCHSEAWSNYMMVHHSPGVFCSFCSLVVGNGMTETILE